MNNISKCFTKKIKPDAMMLKIKMGNTTGSYKDIAQRWKECIQELYQGKNHSICIKRNKM